MPPPSLPSGKGRGGRTAKGGKQIGGRGGNGGRGNDVASRIAEMDGRTIEAESNIEILRAQRGVVRRGGAVIRDTVRENEGVDFADPEKTIDDGIRIEPFNMRREMAEGHFDEGGFYVLNRDEEKEVTDAWLDTVDHAEKTAAFKREEEKKKAGAATASRLDALSRNLKEGSDDEDEKEEEDEEGSKETGEKTEADGQEPSAVKDGEEDEVVDEVCMLEKLICELEPLETPSMALARYAKQGKSQNAPAQFGALPPLKTRSRIRQARSAAVSANHPSKAEPKSSQAPAPRKKKRKFDEFGYADNDREEVEAAGSSAIADIRPVTEQNQSLADAGGHPVDESADSGVANPAAIAAFAEKLAAKEKADQEAAAAFASEMRMTKQVLHMATSESAGPEAQAILNLNADDVCKTRDSEKEVVDPPTEVEADKGTTSRKRVSAEHSEEQKKRRRKIEELTDLCDALLQKGVNVYGSTRELLAIEIREKKGERLGEDATPNEASAANSAVKTDGADAPAAAIVYENRRYSASADEPAVVDASSFDAATAPADQILLWQFRWSATPEQFHGPFDSMSMHGWMTQGCFAEERPAEFRQCDATNSPLEKCWHKWNEIDFELYI